MNYLVQTNNPNVMLVAVGNTEEDVKANAQQTIAQNFPGIEISRLIEINHSISFKLSKKSFDEMLIEKMQNESKDPAKVEF